jgi:hypothetical protein
LCGSRSVVQARHSCNLAETRSRSEDECSALEPKKSAMSWRPHHGRNRHYPARRPNGTTTCSSSRSALYSRKIDIDKLSGVAWIELLRSYPVVRGTSLIGIMEDEACGVNEFEGGVLGARREIGAVAQAEFLGGEIGGATPFDQNSGREVE